MNRIQKMLEIAEKQGVKASIKELSGKTYANVNGVSFVVRGLASFEAKCRELKDYVKPEPIDLTSRLERIENMTISSLI